MNKNIEESLRLEAQIISYYLIKEHPHNEEISLYIKAANRFQLADESALDRRIMELLLKYPLTLGIFDAGLAFLYPESVIRKKLLIMLSILEASNRHHHKFLPLSFKKIHLLKIGQRMVFSVARSVLGIIALKSYGLLWR